MALSFRVKNTPYYEESDKYVWIYFSYLSDNWNNNCVAEGHSEIAEEDLGDNAVIFGLGLGILLNVIVWPYWIGYVIYQVYFVND